MMRQRGVGSWQVVGSWMESPGVHLVLLAEESQLCHVAVAVCAWCAWSACGPCMHACMLSAGADRVVRAHCIASTVVVVAATLHVRPRVHV